MEATDAMIKLQCLIMVSVFVNFFRIQVEESPGRFIFPSILAILEAPSGSGKNATCRFLNDFIFNLSFKSMKTIWEDKEVTFLEEKKEELKEYAVKEYPEEVEKYEEKRRKYVKKNLAAFHKSKRILSVRSATDGSYEGFAFDRAYMESMGYGAPYMFVEEYGNKLIQMKRAAYLRTMYDKLTELVDNDQLGAKSIKAGDGATPGSEGMGITCYFTLSSPTNEQFRTIREGVLQAVGRRAFISSVALEGLNLGIESEHPIYDLDELETFEVDVKNLFDSLHDRCGDEGLVKPTKLKGNLAIPLTAEAREYYKLYINKRREMYRDHAEETLPSDKKSEVATLIKDLDRKVLKVATLLAVFNHGEKNFEITKADIRTAGDIVWESFRSAKLFFNVANITSVEKILSTLKERGEMSARELIETDLFQGISKRDFQTELAGIMMDEVADVAKEYGYEVGFYKKGKQDRYTLKKLIINQT